MVSVVVKPTRVTLQNVTIHKNTHVTTLMFVKIIGLAGFPSSTAKDALVVCRVEKSTGDELMLPEAHFYGSVAYGILSVRMIGEEGDQFLKVRHIPPAPLGIKFTSALLVLTDKEGNTFPNVPANEVFPVSDSQRGGKSVVHRRVDYSTWKNAVIGEMIWLKPCEDCSSDENNTALAIWTQTTATAGTVERMPLGRLPGNFWPKPFVVWLKAPVHCDHKARCLELIPALRKVIASPLLPFYGKAISPGPNKPHLGWRSVDIRSKPIVLNINYALPPEGSDIMYRGRPMRVGQKLENQGEASHKYIGYFLCEY